MKILSDNQSKESKVPDYRLQYIIGTTLWNCDIYFQEYLMESSPRGFLLIINNCKFNGVMSDRIGTDVDCNQLATLFLKLGFGVDIRNDLTALVIVSHMGNITLLQIRQLFFFQLKTIVTLFFRILCKNIMFWYTLTLVMPRWRGTSNVYQNIMVHIYFYF